MTGERRRLHNDKPHNLYCSPKVIGTIKSRRVRGCGVRKLRYAYIILIGNPEGNHSKDLGSDWRIILKCTLCF